ncbi:MAG: hypothetical protein AAB834_07850, partial [Patescibacteria group bacterium]
CNHRHRDGHPITCLMSGRTFVIGNEKLVLFTLVDVTRQREAEREIRDMNQQLERRVQDLHQELSIRLSADGAGKLKEK